MRNLKRILLVEDDENKRNHVLRFLTERFPGVEVDEARSYRSAMNKIRGCLPDLLLLDMAIPNFDIGPGESGGQKRRFGGRDVLRQLDRFATKLPVVILTQFDQFTRDSSVIHLSDLDRELRNDHHANYLGAVYYHPSSLDWQRRLLSLILGTAEQDEGSCLES